MRKVLSLSLRPETIASLKKKAKRKGVTVSYYVRMVLEHEENIISEDELLEMCKRAEKEYREGRTRVLRSFKELEGNL